jgi:hypothetical protein
MITIKYRYDLEDFEPHLLPVGQPKVAQERESRFSQLEDGVIPQGRRNTTLTSLAGSMRRRGMTEDEILAALLVANEQRCEPPLDEEEVRQIAKSVSEYDPGSADAGLAGEQSDSLYVETPRGIFLRKQTRDGPANVQITNFLARIVGSIVEDDGADQKIFLRLEVRLNGRAYSVVVPSKQFGSIDWALNLVGPGAVVLAGFGNRDHARAAIQILSGDIREERIYVHAGWRRVNGEWAYLHGKGAIGPEGKLDEVVVRLPKALSGFSLPSPPSGDALREAVRASISSLEVAPDVVTFALFAAVWTAASKQNDFSLFLAGQTGVGKSELAALAQQCFGPDMDARHLPGSWSSTANALESIAFSAKDCLLVVDDYAPTGGQSDMARLHKEADRLIRGQGNASGRQRMGADGELRATRYPRGLILSTGEDVPRGHSLRARSLVIEVAPGDLDFQRLTVCQRDAADGAYAQTLAGYVQWLAGRYEETRRTLKQELADLRTQASRSDQHKRTPDIIASLAYGLRLFLRFAQEVGAISGEEAALLWNRGWKALGEAALKQGAHQAAEEPTKRFLQLLSGAIASGRAHVATKDGEKPKAPAAWGWRKQGSDLYGMGDDWRPLGARIGWLDGDDLYLEPDASYSIAQAMSRDQGQALPVSQRTLHRRLYERGVLASTEASHHTLTVRRVLEASRRSVLHLKADRITQT